MASHLSGISTETEKKHILSQSVEFIYQTEEILVSAYFLFIMLTLPFLIIVSAEKSSDFF